MPQGWVHVPCVEKMKAFPRGPATQNKKDGLDYLCIPLPFLRISCLDSSGAFWVFSFMSRSLILLDFGSEHLTLIRDALHHTAAVISHSITWCGKTWHAHKPMQCIIISCVNWRSLKGHVFLKKAQGGLGGTMGSWSSLSPCGELCSHLASVIRIVYFGMSD